MKFNIEKQENEIIVKAQIKNRKFARDPHNHVNGSNVIDFLQQSGYNLSEWKMVKTDYCSNAGKTQKLSGTWIFTKEESKVNEKKHKSQSKPTNTRTTRTRKKRTNQKDKLLGNENVGGVQPQTQTSLSGQDKEISGK